MSLSVLISQPLNDWRILSDWLEIALDLFPTCKAVFFESSQNIMTAESLRCNPYQGTDRVFTVW